MMKDIKDNKKSTEKTPKIKEEKVKKRRVIKRKIKSEESDVINKTVEFNLLEVVIIILITGIAVSITSGLIVYNNYDKLFVNSSNEKTEKNDLSEFVEAYNQIINNYVEEVDKSTLIEYAIAGMYSYLEDEYSMYLDKEYTDTLEDQLNGEYTGIGIEITTYSNDEKSDTVITKVFSDTPAQKAGLLVGDKILQIDGRDIVDANDVANTIKNGNKEEYAITFDRNGEIETVNIIRKVVEIDTVFSETYDNVGYLKIESFSNVTTNQVEKLIDKFDKNVDSLVIDLRNNTGGYLLSAYNIADLFIEKDKVIYQLKNRDDKITEYTAQNDVHRKFNKIVIILNENSASASEVLTMALKENLNVTVVGMKSYGKGTVQDTKILESGSMIKYTSAYWLSPKGNSINKIGIEPDIKEIDINEQLNKAIEAAK